MTTKAERLMIDSLFHPVNGRTLTREEAEQKAHPAIIEFVAKTKTVETVYGDLAYSYVKIPDLCRRHCDMRSFHRHNKFNMYTNSDLFNGLINREVRKISKRFWTGNRESYMFVVGEEPENVTIDSSGFLAKVRIEL